MFYLDVFYVNIFFLMKGMWTSKDCDGYGSRETFIFFANVNQNHF